MSSPHYDFGISPIYHRIEPARWQKIRSTYIKVVSPLFVSVKTKFGEKTLHYHFKSALAHVKPLPKAARQTRSPSFILPISQASHNAIGIEAAVVFPLDIVKYLLIGQS